VYLPELPGVLRIVKGQDSRSKFSDATHFSLEIDPGFPGNDRVDNLLTQPLYGAQFVAAGNQNPIRRTKHPKKPAHVYRSQEGNQIQRDKSFLTRHETEGSIASKPNSRSLIVI